MVSTGRVSWVPTRRTGQSFGQFLLKHAQAQTPCLQFPRPQRLSPWEAGTGAGEGAARSLTAKPAPEGVELQRENKERPRILAEPHFT